MVHVKSYRLLYSLGDAETHYSYIHISKLTVPGSIPEHWGQLAQKGRCLC